MNKLKLFGICILFLLCLNVSYGALTNDNIMYFSFDNADLNGTLPIDLTGEGYSIVNNGVVTDAPGILNESFSYGEGDNLNITNKAPLQVGTSDFSYSFWYNPYSLIEGDIIYKKYRSAPYSGFFFFVYEDGRYQAGVRAATTGCYITGAIGSLKTSEWQLITYVRDGTNSNASVYINGNINSSVAHADCNDDASTTNNLNIGNLNTIGTIDEFAFWDRTLNRNEIEYLYNNGTGLTYPFGGGPPGLFWYYQYTDISGKANHGILNNNQTNISTDSGYYGKGYYFNGSHSIETENITESIKSISFWLKKPIHLTNRSLFSYGNYSYGDWEINLKDGAIGYDVNIRVNRSGTSSLSQFTSDGDWSFFTITNNESITTNNFKMYKDGILNYTTNLNISLSTNNHPLVIGNGSSVMTDLFKGYLDNIMLWNKTLTADEVGDLYNDYYLEYNANINTSGILDASYLLLNVGNNTLTTTIEGSGMCYLNFSVGNSTNVTFRGWDAWTDAEITTFTINMTHDDYGWFITDSTTTGNLSFEVLNGNWTVTFDADGYVLETATVEIPANKTFEYNFSKYGTGELYLYFYDEVTGLILNTTNVSVQLSSDAQYLNQTNDTGFMRFENLSANSNFNILYSADGYPTREYYLNFGERNYYNISLYLLNESLADNITVVVYDQYANKVEGAIVKALKQDIPTGTYIFSDMIETDFQGEGVLKLIKSTVKYRFMIEYNSVVKLYTSPAYVNDDLLEFQINIGEQVGGFFYETLDISHSLTYIDNMTFRFIYNDANNAVTQGCLEIYQVNINEETLINSSCTSAATGDITLIFSNATGYAYRADGYVYLGGDKILLEQYIKQFLGAIIDEQNGIMIVIFLTIIMSAAFYYDIRFGVGLSILPLIFANYAGLINLEIQYIIGLIIAAGIVIYALGRQ